MCNTAKKHIYFITTDTGSHLVIGHTINLSAKEYTAINIFSPYSAVKTENITILTSKINTVESLSPEEATEFICIKYPSFQEESWEFCKEIRSYRKTHHPASKSDILSIIKYIFPDQSTKESV